MLKYHCTRETDGTKRAAPLVLSQRLRGSFPKFRSGGVKPTAISNTLTTLVLTTTFACCAAPSRTGTARAAAGLVEGLTRNSALRLRELATSAVVSCPFKTGRIASTSARISVIEAANAGGQITLVVR
jgi:hypothetical protein